MKTKDLVNRLIVILLLFLEVNVYANENATKENTTVLNNTAVSLTLVPPEIITEQVALDVRGAVRNKSNTAKVFEVTCYLDEKNAAGILHRRTA